MRWLRPILYSFPSLPPVCVIFVAAARWHPARRRAVHGGARIGVAAILYQSRPRRGRGMLPGGSVPLRGGDRKDQKSC